VPQADPQRPGHLFLRHPAAGALPRPADDAQLLRGPPPADVDEQGPQGVRADGGGDYEALPSEPTTASGPGFEYGQPRAATGTPVG
jgi:hypothetical protein